MRPSLDSTLRGSMDLYHSYPGVLRPCGGNLMLVIGEGKRKMCFVNAGYREAIDRYCGYFDTTFEHLAANRLINFFCFDDWFSAEEVAPPAWDYVESVDNPRSLS